MTNATDVVPVNVLRLSHFTVENALESILLFNRHGQVNRANAAACQQLGYEAFQINTLHFSDIHPGYDPVQYDQLWQELRLSHTLTLELPQLRRDGAIRQAEIGMNFVRLDGQDYPCRVQADFAGVERILGRDVLNRLEVLFRGPAGEVVVNP